MAPSACWMHRCAPVRLVRSTASQSSSFMRSASVSRVIAALFTRMSRRPKFCERLLEADFHLRGIGHVHRDRERFATRRLDFGDERRELIRVLRAATTTLAPGAASASEVARPMPWDAPVTRATLSFSENIVQLVSFFTRPLRRAPADLFERDCKLAASSTLKQRTERSICRRRPESTLPGPTSTKTLTPCSIISRTESSQRTGMGDLANQRLTRFVTRGDRFGVHIGDHRKAQAR